MQDTAIGIDALAFSGPEHYLEMTALAEARGVDPGKYLHGLGQRQMAIATPCEDTVTMAAAAGEQALKAFDIDPAEIGTLIVGTETGVDHSKPVAVYVHELLGLARNCRTFETKHACYGAMAGLSSSADWIAAGRARGRKALVIASDIARYGLTRRASRHRVQAQWRWWFPTDRVCSSWTGPTPATTPGRSWISGVRCTRSTPSPTGIIRFNAIWTRWKAPGTMQPMARPKRWRWSR
jgi:hypothetical protein